MAQVADVPEVLTLEEAAAFLRVPEAVVVRLATEQAVPGRILEGQWRFLRSALVDWLRERSGKAILLVQAGELADDDSLSQLRETIYHERGRGEHEEG